MYSPSTSAFVSPASRAAAPEICSNCQRRAAREVDDRFVARHASLADWIEVELRPGRHRRHVVDDLERRRLWSKQLVPGVLVVGAVLSGSRNRHQEQKRYHYRWVAHGGDSTGPPGCKSTGKSLACPTAAMRHVFILTLFCILQIPVLAQTTRPLPQPRQAKASDLSTTSASVRDWANRLMAKDPKVRATAEATLVQGGPRSLPLLRRFLNRPNEDLHVVTFEIIRRIGPPAIPLLVDLLRDQRISIRRSAVDDLIDLAPHTERIQPALRRALERRGFDGCGRCRTCSGRFGPRASPSVGALVKTLSHEDPYVRIYAAEALASIGPKAAAATRDLARALGDPTPGVRWAACEALAGIGPAAAVCSAAVDRSAGG